MPINAANFLLLSENYLNSVKVLVENLEKIGPARFAAVFFCAGHSLELSMKAFLISTGLDEKEIKRLSHNLDFIMEECLQRGLHLDLDDRECIRVFNEYYSEHDFRYPNMSEMTLPSHDEMIFFAEKYLNKIKGLVSYD